MSLVIFAHPFSSYCWKVLISLYENDTPFTFRMLAPEGGAVNDEHARLWPIKKMPMLVDDGQVVPEATIIVEHLQLRHPGTVRFLPADPRKALEVRMLDRVFDNYVMTPMQKIVGDALREPGERDARGVADARALLDRTYRWLDGVLAGREWAAGDEFGLADCGAAGALFYADWAHAIDPAFTNVRAYRARVLARPSVARAVDEARPYREFFPLGAPDRD
jgi:glutathione S-transferase